MTSIKIIFFGSTNDSVLVLEKLSPLSVVAIVTQPARPVGRKQIITQTPVELWAKEHTIPVLTFANNPDKPWLFEDQEQVIDALQPFQADLLISASFGQKIPTDSIKSAKFGGLNLHPSLLPRWRGADPVPWAILTGDTQTGVTIVTLEERFDAGKIIAQKKYPITDRDFTDPLRTTLFKIGADLLIDSLPDFLSGKNKGKPQTFLKEPYARRLTRDDGFIAWGRLKKAMEGSDNHEPLVIERTFRGLSPWPGIWTKTKIKSEEKRLKILACHLSSHLLVLDSVQLEGKKPVKFEEFKRAQLS